MKSTFWMTAQEAENEIKSREIVLPKFTTEHYDYTNQAWVGADGKYLSCAHLPEKHCSCYGRVHAGELAPIDHKRLPEER